MIKIIAIVGVSIIWLLVQFKQHVEESGCFWLQNRSSLDYANYFFRNLKITNNYTAVLTGFIALAYKFDITIVQLLLILALLNLQSNESLGQDSNLVLIVPLVYLTSADPITLVFGLEILAALLTIIVLRHIQNNLIISDIKKIFSLFIINMCGFVFLSLLLVWWLFLISNSFTMDIQKSLTTPLICYFTVKYATIGTASLKSVVYEGVPFLTLVWLNLIQIVLVPLLIIVLLNYKINTFVTLIYFIMFNVPFLGKMLQCSGLKTVLLFTTSITNAWGLMFFVI
jgi:hypothetical protein